MGETILLLEDDSGIMQANRDILDLNGYRVLTCSSVKEAQQTVWEETPDLMVLDIRLPDGSGREFCREYRAEYGGGTPVLFLTVMKEPGDIVEGYGAGATDYLVKPFDVQMLVLKVRALLENRKDALESVTVGPLRLDCRNRFAYLNGEDLVLKPKEYAVLEYLARSRNRYVSSDELYEAVWGMKAVGERTVKQHIYRVREKLGEGGPIDIVSQRSEGYRLVRR